MAGVRCCVAATAPRNPPGKVHLFVRVRAVRRRALPALLGRHHRPRVSPISSRRPLLWDRRRGRFSGSWHICQSALRWPTAGRFSCRRRRRHRPCAVTHPRAARVRHANPFGEPVRFEIIFPVTFQSPYGFRHTRYASVSISGRPVSECDRAGRRSVNIGLPPSMNGCEKPFIHGLNRRFTVLNS